MEIIELKPIDNKQIILYLINIESIIESESEVKYIYKILDEFIFNFLTVDLKKENSNKKVHQFILQLTKKYKIPFFSLDLPNHAKKGILNEISKHNEQIEELELEYKVFNSNEIERKSFRSPDLKNWIDYLKNEVKEIENYLNSKFTPQWIVKELLDLIEMFDEKKMYIMHFTTGKILPELKSILGKLEIIVVPFDFREQYSLTPEII